MKRELQALFTTSRNGREVAAAAPAGSEGSLARGQLHLSCPLSCPRKRWKKETPPKASPLAYLEMKEGDSNIHVCSCLYDMSGIAPLSINCCLGP